MPRDSISQTSFNFCATNLAGTGFNRYLEQCALVDQFLWERDLHAAHRMAIQLFGECRRADQEQLPKLGIAVLERTVSRYLPDRTRGQSQTWRTSNGDADVRSFVVEVAPSGRILGCLAQHGLSPVGGSVVVRVSELEECVT